MRPDLAGKLERLQLLVLPVADRLEDHGVGLAARAIKMHAVEGHDRSSLVSEWVDEGGCGLSRRLNVT